MKCNYLINLDDVLVNTSGLIYLKIREHWRIFSKYFTDLGELTYEEIQQRHLFNINEWLIQRKYINLTSEQYSAIQIIINKLMLELCNNEIYEYMKPTLFAENSIMKPLFIDNDFVDNVYIVYRYYTDIEKENKEKFIKNNFINKKIKIIALSGDDSLSDYLKNNDITFNAYIFNSLNELRDIIENNQELNNVEFIRPNYGYNKIPQELEYLIKIRENNITELNQFLKK